jgi:hypothetical protein
MAQEPEDVELDCESDGHRGHRVQPMASRKPPDMTRAEASDRILKRSRKAKWKPWSPTEQTNTSIAKAYRPCISAPMRRREIDYG